MKVTIWTLLLWQRSGDTVSVFPTEDAAKDHLLSFVLANWGRVLPDQPTPDCRETALREFFQVADDMNAFIEPHEITLETPHLANAA